MDIFYHASLDSSDFKYYWLLMTSFAVQTWLPAPLPQSRTMPSYKTMCREFFWTQKDLMWADGLYLGKCIHCKTWAKLLSFRAESGGRRLAVIVESLLGANSVSSYGSTPRKLIRGIVQKNISQGIVHICSSNMWWMSTCSDLQTNGNKSKSEAWESEQENILTHRCFVQSQKFRRANCLSS